MPKVTIGVRVEPELADRIDRIAAEMASRAAGVDVTRGEAARVAAERGVEVLERELGLEASPSTQKGGAKPARKPAK
ncbi:hypothetical protein WMF18_17250 [Sorangium sp. So ce315]|uniref:hypothetical protein n=1 Tax=Sorangium sp. So ce315 TaxID=3133299 RepID=UPI003F621A27